ncbi:hypothetical protein ABPG75_000664 [Micractinium tetrahymenae]
MADEIAGTREYSWPRGQQRQPEAPPRLPPLPPLPPPTPAQLTIRRVEMAAALVLVVGQPPVWRRSASLPLTQQQHAHQAALIALQTLGAALLTMLPHAVWLRCRVLPVAALRVLLVSVPSYRSTTEGTAVLLHRPPMPGLQGWVLDYMTLAMGMRQLMATVFSCLLHHPPLAVLAQQAMHVTLTGSPASYCRRAQTTTFTICLGDVVPQPDVPQRPVPACRVGLCRLPLRSCSLLAHRHDTHPPTLSRLHPLASACSCELLAHPMSQQRMAAVADGLDLLLVLPLAGGSSVAFTTGASPVSQSPAGLCTAVISLHQLACIIGPALVAAYLARRSPWAAAPADQRPPHRGWRGMAARAHAAAARLVDSSDAVLQAAREGLDLLQAGLLLWMMAGCLWVLAQLLAGWIPAGITSVASHLPPG